MTTTGREFQRLQEDCQTIESPDAAIRSVVNGILKNVHTCMPGIIVNFDPATQTAQVQPAIKRIFIEAGAVNLPVCIDVPVLFPGGGDFFLTFPVKAGDECILLFSERAIDLWFFTGEVSPPAEYRLHDLSDGMAIVGLNSRPNALANFNSSQAELRHRTGAMRIKLNPNGIDIIAPSGVTIQGDVTVQGDVIADGISLKQHLHGGVQAGGSDTGVPK